MIGVPWRGDAFQFGIGQARAQFGQHGVAVHQPGEGVGQAGRLERARLVGIERHLDLDHAVVGTPLRVGAQRAQVAVGQHLGARRRAGVHRERVARGRAAVARNADLLTRRGHILPGAVAAKVQGVPADFVGFTRMVLPRVLDRLGPVHGVIGHSLGGAMAANFVYTNPGLVDGLVLWAAYPASSNDLSSSEVRVVSISGTLDGLGANLRNLKVESLILVHGGMAQNVGPILEMVTEKYLLRSDAEWTGRQQAIGLLDEIALASLSL